MSESGASPLTPAVFHVLLALADGPAHGYAIMKRVEEASDLAMGPGTVYGTITRLADAGWIEERDDVEATDARRGRAFGLTGAGRTALAAEANRIHRLAGLDSVRRWATEGGTGS